MVQQFIEKAEHDLRAAHLLVREDALADVGLIRALLGVPPGA
jgi:hypothetical protein